MYKSLFPKIRGKILTLFFMNQEREYYFTEVVRLTNTKQGAIQRELKFLTEIGILIRENRGRQVYYFVNKKNPIYKDLKNIIFKTFGVVDKLKLALSPIKNKIEFAFIYGSFARGEETIRSDIDLFVVGEIKFESVIFEISNTENDINREINTTLFSPDEFKSKYAKKNHFIKSVLDTKLEFIIGSNNDLEKLVEK